LGVWSQGLRGGSWNNNEDNARVTIRNNNHPNNRNNNIGFRVALLHRFANAISLPPEARLDHGQAPRQNWLTFRPAGFQPNTEPAPFIPVTFVSDRLNGATVFFSGYNFPDC